jgi:hypothetical protein
MYECCVGIEIIRRHRSTTTITTMADHSRRRQKSPPSATHKALRPTQSSLLDGRWPPEQADIFFKGLRGCTALKTLLCYGDASSPKQRSALRAIHPLNTPKIISACSGGRLIFIWPVGTRGKFSCGVFGGVSAVGGHGRDGVGIARKLLSQARWFLHCTEVNT